MMDHDMRRFTAYRPAAPDTHTDVQKNAPDEVQYEGVVFSDGTCVLRWRTAVGSFSVWDSFEAAMEIHGHPEYGTQIVWHDEPLPLPWDPDPAADEDYLSELHTAIKEMVADIFGENVNVKVGSMDDFLNEKGNFSKGD